MSTRFVSVDRDQPLLLPPDLREWVPEDDLVHFVIQAVEGLDLAAFKVNVKGSGSAQYPPHMMLSLLIYCYANGVFSSRRIERATHRDVGVRYLSGDTHPDHDTIAKFRRENFDAVAACFVHVLELAHELKLLKVGTVSVDGTTLKANAGKNRNVRYDRAGELLEQLELEVRELMQQAERVDQRDEADGQSLPEEIARPERLKVKLEQARRRLEQRAQKRAQAQQAHYERKVRERQQREGRSKGRILEGDEDEPKMEVLVSAHAEAKQLRRKHDFRPRATEEKQAPQIRSEFVREMKQKMERTESREKYRLRKQTVEPVFGTIKKWMGFTQFLLRGHEKVSGEWQLVTLAYDVKRLWRMQCAQNKARCPA